MNLHRYLFNELMARGQQVVVTFDQRHKDVKLPVNGPPGNTCTLVLGAGAHCTGMVWNEAELWAELSFNNGEFTDWVCVPWASLLKVATPFDDEWQVVATPLSAWTGFQQPVETPAQRGARHARVSQS